jgi:hypothetical protein
VDRNNITGTMADICALSTLGLVAADCSEVVCTCCAPCCTDGVAFHDIDLEHSEIATWESDYQRETFNFSSASNGFELI